MATILVIEDDEVSMRTAQGHLERHGHRPMGAADVKTAFELLHKEPVDLVLTDLNLPDTSGMEVLKRVRVEYPETEVVIMTAYGTIETAVEAMKMGAFDYITKPVHPEELRAVVNRAVERRRLIDEVRLLRSTVDQKYGFESIIGRSQALMQVLESAAMVANTDATVLIRGETGTGKELLAKAIHFNSLRRDRPFVLINCGSIPRELLESELFGHIKGSFTGAMTHKRGKIETADGGTVMLDEIGEMPLDLQVRILRLVEEHEIEKVGATAPIRVDVRILAATHRDLESLVAQGRFREDLYYRLAVIPLVLPPLRERQEDILPLVEYFFRASTMKHGRPSLYLEPSLRSYFVDFAWPGNVRQLENVLERMVLLARSEELGFNDLPEALRAGRAAGAPKIAMENDGISLEAVEREMIIQALRKFNWNQTQAAHYLDISRKTMMYRIAKYGIEKEGPGSGSNGTS